MNDTAELLKLLEALEEKKRTRLIDTLFPDNGPYRRELYDKHMEFFTAGKKFRERCMLSGNRTGKTFSAGLFEVVLHATGQYPEWWPGRRFDHPVDIWVAGKSSKTTRDVLQLYLLGKEGCHGTGLIAKELLLGTTAKHGISGAVEDIYVRHISGGQSSIGLKSYEQGVGSFMGTAKHVILLDEEPPLNIYSECLTRTMIVEGSSLNQKTTGMMLATFTPLEGLSEVVMRFLPDGQLPKECEERFVIQLTWDDVPHLSDEIKKEMLKSIPPHERDARSKGRPQLGSGAIYGFVEEDVVCDPFEIPRHWPRCFGLDVGWNRTAAIWGAWDRESDTLYLYSEHYLGRELPVVHADAIKARGIWIPGLIDPSSAFGSSRDGQQIITDYKKIGLRLYPANNAVESGIEVVRTRFASGQLKVFKTLRNFLGEFRIYRRDQNGKVVKERDHLMDATRYLCMDFKRYAITESQAMRDLEEDEFSTIVGRSKVSGY
jgi:phage terminase large subunit-like protein